MVYVTVGAAGFWAVNEAIAPLSPHRHHTAMAAELSDIQERGYLIVAVKDNVRPLGFRTDQGELAGFEIEIARQLAEDLLGDRNAVVFQPVANVNRIPVVLDGEVDLVIAHLGRTAERSRLVDFSYPYYLDGTGLVTRNVELQQGSDLSGRTLAVLNHSTTIDIVRDRIPGAVLIGADSYQDALSLLETGEADAFAGDLSVLAGWVHDYPAYRILPTPLSAEALAIAMPRGLDYEPLRQAVNQSIERWTQRGWLQEQLDLWGLP